jgi:propanol-preferring alcohol dehydrogenase
MKAWVVRQPGPLAEQPLLLADLPVPEPGPGEVRVQVLACGICRTDLHLAEGDLPPRRPGTVPGHEVVGRVDALGPAATRFAVGDRIGIAWLRRTCGTCRFCRRGAENLCVRAEFTGWDADGGYAEYAVVPEAYAYRLPDRFDDQTAAPLLCAGIVGYRALRRAALPPGGRLGIYGFGASAHLATQVAVAEGARVHVLTRGARARALALELGAASAGDAYAAPPEPLDGAVLFAPVGDLVPVALAALDRGGTLSIAGIHLTDVPPLRYAEHLFFERQVRSTTANTRADGEEFLVLADRMGLRVSTTPFPLTAAAAALSALKEGRITGAGVLIPG